MKVSQLANLRLRSMRTLSSLLLTFLVAAGGAAAPYNSPPDENLSGRWQVSFTLSGGKRTDLIFNAQSKGIGSFLMKDSERNVEPIPATWSQTTNHRVNFSGEIELQFSPCCRETGTLIFKGKFKSSDTITGNAIFIGTTENEENFTGYVSTAGTFTATRLPDVK